MMNVFTYWEGPRVPYIELCLDTIRKHCYRDCLFHHVTEANIDQYIPEGTLHPNWKKIKELGVKSDCVRAACLALYGGLYIDADTVMLQSPAGYIDEDAEVSYMEWTNPPRRAIAGYIYCKPHSIVASHWLTRINSSLEQGKWGWTDLGERCLTPAVDSVPLLAKQQLKLDTFLPIEIDCEVMRFFKQENWENLVGPHTIGFGLNHSWFMGHRRETIDRPFGEMERSTLLIHKLLLHASKQQLQPNITVCCPTYRRPELLGKMIHCFEQQDYLYKNLLIFEDGCKEHRSIQTAKNDTSYTVGMLTIPSRVPSLGRKRNELAQAAASSWTDAIAMWDDDDLYMPWALSALAAGLKRADWVRASQALIRQRVINPKRGMELSQFHPVLSYSRQDKSDKAFHPAWAYSVAAFKAAGGYPPELSLGEDLGLACKFRDLRLSEADPIELGYDPYAIFGPWDNEHFSYPHHTYEEWGDKLQPTNQPVVSTPSIRLEKELILDKVLPRPFGGDWWEDTTA